jgi:tripartite-type tricarboxylate transporter receptor subunit TctC
LFEEEKMRKNQSGLLAITVAAALTPLIAPAQQYPAKPVRVIVPFAPGGGADIVGRIVANKLSVDLGQQFVVDNRGGAGGLIGMEQTARAVPDGYTVMIISGSFTATAATHKASFDPITAIVPVAEVTSAPFVLSVHPSLPSKTTKDFIALARSRPDQLAYASSGIGGLTHLTTELFASMAKIKMVHIPFKSTGAAMTDLLTGNTPVIVGSLPPLVALFQAGKLRPLAVTTDKRWHSVPTLPTIGETLPGYEVKNWFGMLAPAKTPQNVIDRLNGAINKALQDPDMKKQIDTQGMLGTGGTAAAFGEYIRKDYARWVRVVKESGIKVE